ncbi:synaptotagmin-like protein 3 [Kryptolebias marmoratus]|uniref:synaptotagmin-like protein 3 n=1 Tax=Kryptolebias marmoratus TaxID=37003 RepID=UPI0007F8A74A|nr:synaptotagmin-like protein 3 [Kryptolebias marmoratus]
MDLSFLQALEREKVLEVLRRDKHLRTVEEDRIRRMKCELQELRRKGAKNYARQYGERTCARCQRSLGKLWNPGAVCRGCSHRICSRCRVGAADWKCTLCHAYREMKIRSGQWFLEEKAKKFSVTTDKYKTTGEKLLGYYSVQRHISVVPPTPPPHLSDCQFRSKFRELKNSKSFTKSMEDLMVCFKTHIKKISSSQTDVRGDTLTVDGPQNRACFQFSTQKSQSDTNINKSSSLSKGDSFPSLFKRSRDSDQDCSSTGADEETSFSSEHSAGNRGSISSISTECGVFDNIFVAGELELAVAFDTNSSCLEITVGACRNLAYGDSKKKKCHPYVKLYVLPDKSVKLKTSLKKNTTDPVYNEVLKYDIERPLLFGKRLQASVWHSGTLTRKVFLGEVLIPLDGWRSEDKGLESFHWYPLCPKAEKTNFGAAEQNGNLSFYS